MCLYSVGRNSRFQNSRLTFRKSERDIRSHIPMHLEAKSFAMWPKVHYNILTNPEMGYITIFNSPITLNTAFVRKRKVIFSSLFLFFPRTIAMPGDTHRLLFLADVFPIPCITAGSASRPWRKHMPAISHGCRLQAIGGHY